MKPWVRWLLLLCLPAIAAFFLLWSVRPSHPAAMGERREAGKLTPHEKGSAFAFSSLHRKVGVVNFWATWCHPCLEEIAELLGAAKELEPKGVVLLAVNADGDNDAKPFVEEFLLQHPSDLSRYIVYADEAFNSQFDFHMLPTT